MSSSDKSYIIIENSRNLDDDTIEPSKFSEESPAAFGLALQNQGIFLENSDSEAGTTAKNIGDFSKELLNEGGIEIITKEEEYGEEIYS